jgi:hypothetical protein
MRTRSDTSEMSPVGVVCDCQSGLLSEASEQAFVVHRFGRIAMGGCHPESVTAVTIFSVGLLVYFSKSSKLCKA